MVSLTQARAVRIGLLLIILLLSGHAVAAPLRVVAAENIYGDIAAQIGGDAVSVTSVLNNPAQDPHEFEASASVARAVADADLVIYNGANYDPWMAKLLAASKNYRRKVIVVSELNQLPIGDNPHLWYEWAIVLAVADAVAIDLANADASDADGYKLRTKTLHDAMTPIAEKAAAMRRKYDGTAITATEPVFDLMAWHIGLEIRNVAFARAVMNGTEPSARDVAAFEDDLKNHRVKALLYNTQSGGELSQRMKAIAEAEKIPVVGISETEPPGVHYQDWMLAQLDILDAALSGAPQ